MTLDKFAEHWKISKGEARTWLINNKFVEKDGFHFVYDPISIAEAHEFRILTMTPKQDGEMFYKDIIATYKVTQHELNKLIETCRFPKIKRRLRAYGANNQPIYNRDDVVEFFKTYTVTSKKNKKTIIKGERADLIHFITGRVSRYGTPIKVNFKHWSLWESMKE